MTSQVSVAGRVSGKNGSAAKPAASRTVRATPGQPILELPPKQAQGRPARPLRIAATSAAAKTRSIAAAASAAPGTRAATVAPSAASAAITAPHRAARAGGDSIPYERKAA